ncbi:MAG: hypothetical protein C1942_07330 [Prosthecochloris sp.]|uniref:bifunctional aminoglycoside phosphotransferase/ATP-binding protein n=1 Tax=Prosthecochloris sp. TaxID=290513 RepID=UPI0013C7CC42|nr:bifunctional aminoglycoside phosphotransferase/ATP-binding protein [Prosthecochloris sp.]NEX12484.1 hypothetical protein [Prosthecochloris sp.]
MLFTALQNPGSYPHDVTSVTVVETHISMVFLTGIYAYKVKKPVDLGFLDFSTLERRKQFCLEELRLNRRLCPDLYLDVVPITEDNGLITVGGKGNILEYAVQMLEFDRTMELDLLLKEHRLSPAHIDMISAIVSAFHQALSPSPPGSPYATPALILQTVLNNFSRIETGNCSDDESERLEKLKVWTVKTHEQCSLLFEKRKREGLIRQCHGDMHSGNMVLRNGGICIFDCIEFNPELSVIDLFSEIAFFIMDLEHRCHPELAWRFLNAYLSATGDYDGLKVLRFYAVYRAMVRAKVTSIRLLQENDARDKTLTHQEHLSFISLAENYTTLRKPVLILTRGVSGSGKTTLAAELSSLIPAVHCRSDVERKRIFGLSAKEKSRDEDKKTIYADASTRQTYARLLDIAATCIDEHYSVIVDATFMTANQREPFLRIAREKKCPLVILECSAPLQTLEKRIINRLSNASDASEAGVEILYRQMEKQDSLSLQEEAVTIRVNTTKKNATQCTLRMIREKIS